MEGKNILTIITLFIAIACVAITIFLWYTINTNETPTECIQKYNAIIDDKTDTTNPVYYILAVDAANKPIISHFNADKIAIDNFKDPTYSYSTMNVVYSPTPPSSESFIPNLKNIYKEKFANCTSGKCNSRHNEWESSLSSKPCTNPNCKEHFDPKKYGLYDNPAHSKQAMVYINPENSKKEMYDNVSSTGIPKVDLKDKLRSGSSIIRGDVPIVPTGQPIVGASRFRHESLTPALFY